MKEVETGANHLSTWSGSSVQVMKDYLKNYPAGKRKTALEMIMDAYKWRSSIPAIYTMYSRNALRDRQALESNA